ncbi:MAG: ribonuclease HIII [Bacilli bacterium]|nr:ribonuclease HIII [Bacilli bacterium]
MEPSRNVTLSLPDEAIAKMEVFYAEFEKENPSPYVDFFAVGEEVAITVYRKKKDGCRKVVFQGEKAEYESSIWKRYCPPVETPSKPTLLSLSLGDQIGSDEVGTGDFFGPVIVVAAYVPTKDLPLLKELGVTDSKALSDERIRTLGPELLQRLDHSLLILDNPKYNEVIAKGENMNSIKAKLHNRALLNVSARHVKTAIYQDQFAAPKLYYSYLQGEKEVCKGIIFATKGESKFPSVAAASCIARYVFLCKMEEMGKRYDMEFPLGAGPSVNRFGKSFVKRFGVEELQKVAKVNFANMKKILPQE